MKMSKKFKRGILVIIVAVLCISSSESAVLTRRDLGYIRAYEYVVDSGQDSGAEPENTIRLVMENNNHKTI